MDLNPQAVDGVFSRRNGIAKGKDGAMIDTMNYNSPIGSLFLAAKENALVGLWMDGQKYFLGSVKEEMRENASSEILSKTKDWLDRYFKGEKPEAGELPLAPQGSEFRKAVWKILCTIPYGETISYGEIAHRIASSSGIERMSAQAVGGAVGHNPISIIIPCHRVVGSNGSLTGYAGGLEKKVCLLTLEGVDMGRFFVP